jgi:signal transduction histidine kinase/CHASE1-domain containing sensor protein
MPRLPSPLTLARRHAAQLVALLVGLGSTLLAWGAVERTIMLQRQERFRQAVETSTTAVRERMEAYTTMLYASRGLFDALGEVPSREAFETFVRNLDVGRRYPGVQGIGFAELVLPAQLAGHETRMRATGLPLYALWPAGERDLYTSIVYIEPLDWRNARAIGYDMYSEPVRREAMARARDTGGPAASGRVELVQEAGTERQAGFLVYLPVYARAPATAEERHSQLRGWLYAPFRAADLLQRTVGAGAARDVGLQVYDGAEVRPDALLFDARAEEDPELRVLVERIDVAGRPWTLRFAATGAFVSRTERILPGLTVAIGLAVTALLLWIVRRESVARRRAERAARRTAFLAEAGKILSSSLDYARTLPEVATLAAEEVADGALLYVEEEGGPPLWCAGQRDDPALARRLEAALDRGAAPPPSLTGVAAVMRSGEPELVVHPGVASAADDPEVAELARRAGARALITVPVGARGRTIGAVTLAAQRRLRRFGPEDLALAEDLARLVGAAVDTARLYRDAQAAVRERDDFLSIASHELKTPLTSLALQSESLRAAARRGDADGTVRKADVVRRNVKRLSALVASMLDLSRIRAGRLELELEAVDLAEVAQEVAARFEEEAQRAGCELRLDVPGPVIGRWDRLRVDQVVTNLLSNAVKYGPGKPVDVRVEAAADQAVLTVRDHGIGISATDQARIFEPFERAVSERHYGGFGLGLWIVRHIVESLGGEVRVASAPGEGSTFTVTLELEPRLAQGAAAGAVGAPSGAER